MPEAVVPDRTAQVQSPIRQRLTGERSDAADRLNRNLGRRRFEFGDVAGGGDPKLDPAGIAVHVQACAGGAADAQPGAPHPRHVRRIQRELGVNRAPLGPDADELPARPIHIAGTHHPRELDVPEARASAQQVGNRGTEQLEFMRARGFVNLRRHDGGDRTARGSDSDDLNQLAGAQVEVDERQFDPCVPGAILHKRQVERGIGDRDPAPQMDRQTALIELVRQARDLLDAFERSRGSVADTRGLPEQQSRSEWPPPAPRCPEHGFSCYLYRPWTAPGQFFVRESLPRAWRRPHGTGA